MASRAPVPTRHQAEATTLSGCLSMLFPLQVAGAEGPAGHGPREQHISARPYEATGALPINVFLLK